VEVAPAKVLPGEPGGPRPGQLVRVTITGTPLKGYHTYPITRRTANQKVDQLTKLSYEPSKELQALWPVEESAPEAVKEGGEGWVLEHQKPFTWSQDVLVLPEATPGKAILKAKVQLQLCNDQHCLPKGDIPLEIPVEVKEGPEVEVNADLAGRQFKKEPEPEVVNPNSGGKAPEAQPGPEGSTDRASSPEESASLLGFMLKGFGWGFISLLTPCVFPMIPITVSFFLKAGTRSSEQESYYSPLVLASVYCGTIILVLTIAGMALLTVFQAFINYAFTNFGLGALFIFFALSLFGMYEIELPSGLAQFTSSREGKGGLTGTIFMALTFTIISFACVAPFLGGFGGTSPHSRLTWIHRLLGSLAFATAFASPFFLLALFPAMLKSMPRSGTWLNNVKVVMGFLEVAAALKFLQAGEVALTHSAVYLNYDLILSIYVGLCFLAGTYILGSFRLPHDTPLENLSVSRFLIGSSFICLGIYLTPALFKDANGANQRPSGPIFAWIDAFLQGGDKRDLEWKGFLDKALTEATAKGRRVFVDFTAKNCPNCRLNERNVFTLPRIKELFGRYTLVTLYTDQVPDEFYTEEERKHFKGDDQQKADGKANFDLQSREFDNTQLPLYAILEPLPKPDRDGKKFKVVGAYTEGKINDPDAFAEFLRKGLTEGAVAGAK
jgi:thiol:disulfide interchange protein DsbD